MCLKPDFLCCVSSMCDFFTRSCSSPCRVPQDSQLQPSPLVPPCVSCMPSICQEFGTGCVIGFKWSPADVLTVQTSLVYPSHLRLAVLQWSSSTSGAQSLSVACAETLLLLSCPDLVPYPSWKNPAPVNCWYLHLKLSRHECMRYSLL